MLLKSCARCGKLIAYPATYCDGCKPAAEEDRRAALEARRKKSNQSYNAKRNPKYGRFYASVDWKRVSRAKMAEAHYRCESCGGLATEVHHIQPIQTADGWEGRLDWNNLQALCLKCHNAAHRRFGYRKR